MNKNNLLSILVLLFITSISAQETVEIFLIDSYVTPEAPYTFVVSFFTTEMVTSKIVINASEELVVSDSLTDNHQGRFDFSSRQFDSTMIPFRIIVFDEFGNKSVSDQYDLALPSAAIITTDDSPSFFTVCCFGGVIFGLPSPGLMLYEDKSYFSLSKEIPVISFYSSGYNYPVSYLGLEYSYTFNAPVEHVLRAGYKYIWQPEFIEYISSGINVFTNFKGKNGISPELTFGLFKVYNVFTLYTKYRFNVQPGGGNVKFHEISIGLYSNVFSINF